MAEVIGVNEVEISQKKGGRGEGVEISASSNPLDTVTGMVVLAPKWVKLALNGTNPGLFQI